MTTSAQAANAHQPPNHTTASTIGMATTDVIVRRPTERYHCLSAFSAGFVSAFCSPTGCTQLLITGFMPQRNSRCLPLRVGDTCASLLLYATTQRDVQNAAVADGNSPVPRASLRVQNRARASALHNTHCKLFARAGSY